MTTTITPAIYRHRDNPANRVEAVQLADDADWEAIAAWCGGRLVTHRDISDEAYTELRIYTDRGWYWTAYDDDWVVRTDEGFKTFSELGSDWEPAA